MNRRGFLGAMLGLAAAPAIVKAENIMKIWVPPEPSIITLGQDVVTVGSEFLGNNAFTIETWVYPTTVNTWVHVAMTKDNDGNVKRMINGKEVKNVKSFPLSIADTTDKVRLQSGVFDGYLQDLKITRKCALDIPQYEGLWPVKTDHAIYMG